MSAVRPELATLGPVAKDQVVDPLPTNPKLAHSSHQASDLVRTPTLADQSAHPGDQRRRPLVGLGRLPSSLIAALLRL